MKKAWVAILLACVLLIQCAEEKHDHSIGGFIKVPASAAPVIVKNVPHPFIENQQEIVDMYWKSWEYLSQKIARGNPQNGFADEYLDEGFNDLIYQWDTCFMALFAMYGFEQFPVMASLDNFYSKQREDGWICRVYRESDGTPPEIPTATEPMLNPPLFAFVEWKYYLLTGDNSRFGRVLPVLDKYFNWIDQNARGKGRASGLYFTTGLGSGMDNSPREKAGNGGWIDISAQMALFAKYMRFIARDQKADSLHSVYEKKYRLLSRLIQSQMWHNQSGFFYDIDPLGRQNKVKTAAAFWTMLAEVASQPQVLKLAEHLQNPDEFYRKHLFPTLAADEPDFDPAGHYWRGGVWAPINYMIIKGLDLYPQRELAAVAAMNHIKNIAEVFYRFQSDENKIAEDERDGDYQTIWECYSPDLPQPATRWDGENYGRQDFVGWSGLGPVALLLENVMGLQPSALRDELYWNLRIRDHHGVRNYRFGDNRITLICERNELPVGPAQIVIESKNEFNLIVSSQVGLKTFSVKPGLNLFTIML